ncbi:hypothetical protein ABZP36_009167 [Zizania latifolia]
MDEIDVASEAPPAESFPCLIFDYGYDADDEPLTNIYSVAQQKHYALTPDMKDNWIVPTPQGWVLLVDPDSFAASLKNPITDEAISLPPLTSDFPEKECLCLLSDKPTAAGAGCTVILMSELDSMMWFCHIGGSEWTKHRYDIGNNNSDGGPCTAASIVAHKGKFYYSLCGRLGVLEFSPQPVFTWLMPKFSLVFPNHDGATTIGVGSLVESSGELFLVYLFYFDMDLANTGEVHSLSGKGLTASATVCSC